MPDERSHPTPGQLDAAIAGARDMVEAEDGADRQSEEAREPSSPNAGGHAGGAGGTAQGGANTTAGPSQMPDDDPSQETGGPRGVGYPPSSTSGGRINRDGDPHGVEADEFVKRETAVFEPGTGRKPTE
jgi:hypothetical protein